ncbi:IS6 family transposase [Parablastomonas sp. CN1-191]|uniref:IS6 family transposase n=1 Tax=Parablastomonas sp. CN1-191 TaxID=3400908 RepID=UPI003BF7ADF6
MPRKSGAKPRSPFRRFNSSPEVIRLVVLMYVRFPLSLRNVEDLLFERGIDICHETVRLWLKPFGPLFASDIGRQRVNRMRGFRHWRWHLDEMYVNRRAAKPTSMARWSTCGGRPGMRKLESYITRTRDKEAALRFMKKALKRHRSPEKITTDGLRSYRAAMNELGNAEKQEVGRWANNRVENSTCRPDDESERCSLQANEDAPEVRVSSRQRPQSPQPGAPPRRPPDLQAAPLSRTG